MEENMNEWHSVGTESVTVPAGTFSCEHWRNDKSNSDIWTSDKVTPFGMVKEVSPTWQHGSNQSNHGCPGSHHRPRHEIRHAANDAADATAASETISRRSYFARSHRSGSASFFWRSPSYLTAASRRFSSSPLRISIVERRASNKERSVLMTSEKFLPAKILDRRVVADDLFLLHVDPGGPFSYLAGQYATLGVEVEGERIERAYSLCSSPYENVLEFFVERVPTANSPRSSMPWTKALLFFFADSPKAALPWTSAAAARIICSCATVTGVAPYVSYIRTVRADWKKGGTPMPGEHRLFCIQGASRSSEFGYRDELEKYAAEAPWLKYVPAISRPWEDPGWQGERGRVDDLIRKYIHLWGLTPEDTSAYLCGHPGMVESGRGILLRAGWSKQAIQDEVYFQPGKEASAT